MDDGPWWVFEWASFSCNCLVVADCAELVAAWCTIDWHDTSRRNRSRRMGCTAVFTAVLVESCAVDVCVQVNIIKAPSAVIDAANRNLRAAVSAALLLLPPSFSVVDLFMVGCVVAPRCPEALHHPPPPHTHTHTRTPIAPLIWMVPERYLYL